MQDADVKDSALFLDNSAIKPFARGSVAAAHEDYELPMLEHAAALSDGYASPRELDLNVFRRESLDLEAAGASFDGAVSDASPLRSKAVTRRCGWCSSLCTFVLNHWSKAALVALIITLIVLVSVKGVKIFSEILNFFERWNSWGGWGIFIGMFILNVTLFLPSVALILGAGFIFGFWKGLLAVWAGGAVGQSLSFLLARYLVKDMVATYVAKRWSKWDLVDHVLAQEGWKMVLLLRLSPVVPWNLLNIAMASTNVSFFQFTVASAIGIGFESSVLCYFGSLAQNIRDIVSGNAKPEGKVVYILAGISIFFCFLAAILATLSVRRAMKRAHTFRQTQDIPPSHGGGPSDSLGFLQQGVDGGGHEKLPMSDSFEELPRSMAAMLQKDSGFSSGDSDDGGGSPHGRGDVLRGTPSAAGRNRAFASDNSCWLGSSATADSLPEKHVGGSIQLRSTSHSPPVAAISSSRPDQPSVAEAQAGGSHISPAGYGGSGGVSDADTGKVFQDRGNIVPRHGIAA